MPYEERRRTAYHESGHALLGMLQPGADPVRKVTIVPRGRALGVTLSTPDSDKYAYTEEYLRGRIIGALGGMAAEQLVFDVITTGAENDLEQVTNIVRGMVGRWGMSEQIGPLVRAAERRPAAYGLSAAPGTLDAIAVEMRRIVDECYEHGGPASCARTATSWTRSPRPCWRTRPWRRRPPTARPASPACPRRGPSPSQLPYKRPLLRTFTGCGRSDSGRHWASTPCRRAGRARAAPR